MLKIRSGKVTVTGRLGSPNLDGRPPRFFSALDFAIRFNVNTCLDFGFYIDTRFLPESANQKFAMRWPAESI